MLKLDRKAQRGTPTSPNNSSLCPRPASHACSICSPKPLSGQRHDTERHGPSPRTTRPVLALEGGAVGPGFQALTRLHVLRLRGRLRCLRWPRTKVSTGRGSADRVCGVRRCDGSLWEGRLEASRRLVFQMNGWVFPLVHHAWSPTYTPTQQHGNGQPPVCRGKLSSQGAIETTSVASQVECCFELDGCKLLQKDKLPYTRKSWNLKDYQKQKHMLLCSVHLLF